jgi:L-alanine-DL-glutamate epimerase-like enolase superfamily enzyme
MAENVAGYRRQGYRRFQLKAGGDPGTGIARIRAIDALPGPGEVLVADANAGWLMHEAARVVHGVRDVDVYIEQPCLGYEECLSIRRRTDHPPITHSCSTNRWTAWTCCGRATPTGPRTW